MKYLNKIKSKNAVFIYAVLLISLFVVGLANGVRPQTVDAASSQIIEVTDENSAQIFSTKIGTKSDETYAVKDRQWQGGATVCITGERLWATWMSGGVNEPDEDNYDVIVYSDDAGESWVDPFIIVDKKGTADYCPIIWTDDLGRLWFFWNVGGCNAIRIDNPEAEPEDIVWTDLGIIMPNNISSVPTALSDGTYLATIESEYFFRNEQHVYASTDKGKTWVLRGYCETQTNVKRWHEGRVVELSDGTLWLVTRLEKGTGFESSYSYDGGFTWTPCDPNTVAPIVGPASKAFFITLESGNLLFVNHASQSARTNLTAYLSTDDGETWTDGLLLDDSYLCEYPTVCQGDDGMIYVIWARGRTLEAEIRMARLTEDDITNCSYSENSKTMMLVSRGSGYSDIIGLKSAEQKLTVKKGTDFEAVKSRLPANITITNENGLQYTYPAEYICPEYDGGTQGTYRIVISLIGAEDDLLQDVHKMLFIDVTVMKGGGCKGAITMTFPAVSIILAVAAVTFFVIKKNKRKLDA